MKNVNEGINPRLIGIAAATVAGVLIYFGFKSHLKNKEKTNTILALIQKEVNAYLKVVGPKAINKLYLEGVSLHDDLNESKAFLALRTYTGKYFGFHMLKNRSKYTTAFFEYVNNSMYTMAKSYKKGDVRNKDIPGFFSSRYICDLPNRYSRPTGAMRTGNEVLDTINRTKETLILMAFNSVVDKIDEADQAAHNILVPIMSKVLTIVVKAGKTTLY